MGAGKSHFLKELLTQLGDKYQYIDLDDYILDTVGQDFESLGKYIEDLGLEDFREIEFAALSELSKLDNLIIALGGGTITSKTKPILDKDFLGFHIDVPFEKCLERIKGDSNRPLASLPEDQLRDLYFERDKLYRNYKRVRLVKDVLEHVEGKR